ncbi:MAG: hypothetical protein WCN88_01425 [Candidatus Falkowbacteria bacterium]
MLNALFGSEARVKLLNLFLLHPETKYYIQQIARELKLTSNSAQKEIDSLVKLGLVATAQAPISQATEGDAPTESKKNNKKNDEKKLEKKYFEINGQFILYPEIKALFIKSQILSSQKFISSLEKNFQPKLLILTGFFTNYPEAQTDLLIVGNVKRPAFLKIISELEKDLGHEINFTILDDKEFKYRQEIMDIFLYNILEGKTIVLIDNFTHK